MIKNNIILSCQVGGFCLVGVKLSSSPKHK